MYRFLESRVADYMTRPVLTVTPETPVHELERQFVDHDFNGFPVLAAGVLVGVVTKFDVLKAFIFACHFLVRQAIPHAFSTIGKARVCDLVAYGVLHSITRSIGIEFDNKTLLRRDGSCFGNILTGDNWDFQVFS